MIAGVVNMRNERQAIGPFAYPEGVLGGGEGATHGLAVAAPPPPAPPLVGQFSQNSLGCLHRHNAERRIHINVEGECMHLYTENELGWACQGYMCMPHRLRGHSYDTDAAGQC